MELPYTGPEMRQNAPVFQSIVARLKNKKQVLPDQLKSFAVADLTTIVTGNDCVNKKAFYALN